jgi:hypothetical protein
VKTSSFIVTKYDAQMTCTGISGTQVLEPALRMKAQADSSSRGQKDFVCREEKRNMVKHAGGPRNQ